MCSKKMEYFCTNYVNCTYKFSLEAKFALVHFAFSALSVHIFVNVIENQCLLYIFFYFRRLPKVIRIHNGKYMSLSSLNKKFTAKVEIIKNLNIQNIFFFQFKTTSVCKSPNFCRSLYLIVKGLLPRK